MVDEGYEYFIIFRALAWLHRGGTISVTKHAPSCNVGETYRKILWFKYRKTFAHAPSSTWKKGFWFLLVRWHIFYVFYLLGSYKWKQQGYRTQIDIALSVYTVLAWSVSSVPPLESFILLQQYYCHQCPRSINQWEKLHHIYWCRLVEDVHSQFIFF